MAAFLFSLRKKCNLRFKVNSHARLDSLMTAAGVAQGRFIGYLPKYDYCDLDQWMLVINGRQYFRVDGLE